jgi:hypothetical protein
MTASADHAAQDSQKLNCVQLAIEVESAFDWKDTREFYSAEYKLRNLIRSKLAKWGATPRVLYEAASSKDESSEEER